MDHSGRGARTSEVGRVPDVGGDHRLERLAAPTTLSAHFLVCGGGPRPHPGCRSPTRARTSRRRDRPYVLPGTTPVWPPPTRSGGPLRAHDPSRPRTGQFPGGSTRSSPGLGPGRAQGAARSAHVPVGGPPSAGRRVRWRTLAYASNTGGTRSRTWNGLAGHSPKASSTHAAAVRSVTGSSPGGNWIKYPWRSATSAGSHRSTRRARYFVVRPSRRRR